VASICFQHCEGPKSLHSSSITSPFLLFASLPLPPFSPPLRSSPLIQLGGLGSAVSSYSGVWGKAPAANNFGAFRDWRNAAGGIQDARFQTTENSFYLHFLWRNFPRANYCFHSVYSHIIVRVQAIYCEGPDPRTLTRSTPLTQRDLIVGLQEIWGVQVTPLIWVVVTPLLATVFSHLFAYRKYDRCSRWDCGL